MARYVVDSWAWMEYLDGSEAGRMAKSKIEDREAFTSAITIAEVVSRVSRKGSDADMAFNSIVSLSKIVYVDEEFAKKVGLLHSSIKKRVTNFSLADAFVLQTAKNLDAKVLTGDPDFKGIKDAEMLK